jgi:hypothetical protein
VSCSWLVWSASSITSDAEAVAEGRLLRQSLERSDRREDLRHFVLHPETNKRVLVDHTFIVAGGEITRRRATGLAMLSMLRSAARSCSWTETTS